LKIIEDFKPKHIAISFDRREKTFRHKITETYKANRPPTPDELHQQIEPIKNFFNAIGLKEISKAGYEADDVLATLATKYKNRFEIVIISGDKDFSQLVEDKITLYDLQKKITSNRKKIIEKYGISPKQFIDYLAICGDSADNIPGVKGIGPKGAEKLLNTYDSLDCIYENIENISNESIRKKLIEQKEGAYLSQKLVTIIKDVPIEIADEEDFIFEKNKLQNGIKILKDFELNSIIKKLQKLINQYQPVEIFMVNQEFDFGDNDDKLFQTVLVDSEIEFQKLVKKLNETKVVALNTKTTSINPHLAELVGISLCCDEKTAYYLPLKHQMAENLETEKTVQTLKKLLENKLIIGHNLKYDYLILQNSDWKLEENIFDTMLAHYLLYPTSRHSLTECVLYEFQHKMIPISEVIGKGKKQITFDLVPTMQAAEYSAEDAYFTFRLYEIYSKKLETENLLELYKKLEIPLIYVLAKMEKNGVNIDADILKNISIQNQKRIGDLTKNIYDISGSQFNLNSPKQLSVVLFEDLGIKPIKKIKTGFSTNIEVLEILAKNHNIAKLLIEYRQLSKLESTYVATLPQLINFKTGKVHSSFNQTVASTGRLSSSNPNLQNIPIRTEFGKEIRKAFCASDNEHMILSADYSQIELRILAILSEDKKMINAFNNGLDIHSQTAAVIYDSENITADQRRFAKIINFGLMYGMGSFRISQELNISRNAAKDFIANYFSKFPTIKKYLNSEVEKARKTGFVSTIFGRKLYLPEIKSSNKMKASGAERVAVNMPIQGSAADIIKIAMINIHKKIKDNPDIKMIIQVHDELVFEIKKDRLEDAKRLIISEMANTLPKKYSNIIPIKVDVGIGENWFDAH